MESKNKAIILGCLGQMGSTLAELLNSKGYEIHGIVKEDTAQDRIDWLTGLVPTIKIYRINILKYGELSDVINNVAPEVIYNFAGKSDIFSPWDNLDNILELNAKVPQNILEIIVNSGKNIRFFQASSCLVFGKDKSGLQNELTPRCPMYAYGAAKMYSDSMVASFRENFNVFACSGIMFPTESSRRGEGFFTKKVCKAVAEIKLGIKTDKLKLGDLTQMRDWLFVDDAVDAIYRMMQAEKPQDYVIGSGVLTSTEFFVREAFGVAKLDYLDHIEQVPEFTRKKDMWALCANNRKAKLELKWTPKVTVQQLIEKMVNYELEKLKC